MMINESKEKHVLTHILVTGPLVQGNMGYVGASNMIVIIVVKKVLASFVAANHSAFFSSHIVPLSGAGGGAFHAYKSQTPVHVRFRTSVLHPCALLIFFKKSCYRPVKFRLDETPNLE